MKLTAVKLRNFRGYLDETVIAISELTALIGRNDAGKSTILEALEIFFNNKLITCEQDDLNVNADDPSIEITCSFSELPTELVLDATHPTTLADEYLLNHDGQLEIKKVFSATAVKPKEKAFIVCEHPAAPALNDLHTLKITQLRSRAKELGIEESEYDGRTSSSIRAAIWRESAPFDLASAEIPTDKEDGKRFYDAIKNRLPLFALFQSDRRSTDDDTEVADPMKIAIDLALSELTEELENIKERVRQHAIETAQRTLSKMQEMAPELASELVPEFKSDPKFNSLFKLAIKSDDSISINKRGSGVRRLILLNFFRAEAERKRHERDTPNVIYAFEEPETSQHPDHQEMLVRALIELSSSENTQVLLTTHTPALAAFLPLDSLRHVTRHGSTRTVESGSDEVFEQIADSLGILPDPIAKNASVILLVEGKGDITFVNHTAASLKEAGYLEATLEERGFAVVPIGGCGNIKHWRTKQIAHQFGIPYCVLLDSDKGTLEESKNRRSVDELRAEGIKAYLTVKREPENYIAVDCLELQEGDSLSYSDTDDAKTLIQQCTRTKESEILDKYWPRMTGEQIRIAEHYHDGERDRFEFTEMFTDFLSLL